ncbi:3-hydroxyacyl-ACP dehydratase FabZ family protein [Dankookia rubra]|uniref:3-hydroxyacyl-ACP dehydratase FabZ family protein n=1 Tax=Dankookia rubra TaxID=1442381 RepID=UPI0019D57153|nr:beta-hydroxyacyl-ACP dehydratase [Dankookia rubra]
MTAPLAGPATRVTIPADHPALPGHFPGRPIVPGVLLLDAVMQAAGLGQGLLRRAKFLAPVLPGDAIEIDLVPGPGRLGFACRCRGTTVLSGEFAWPPA